MGEIFTVTLKYFWLAIDRFMPVLSELKRKTSDKNEKEELSDLIEAYQDIQNKIRQYNLNFEDPNRNYPGEPFAVKNWLNDGMVENLGRLSLRLLVSWKKELEKLKAKQYLTDNNKEKIHQLENLIWPLDALSKAGNYVVGKYADKGPLIFPSESKTKEIKPEDKNAEQKIAIFPKALMSKIPPDLVIICDEFNFNHVNNKPNAGILLLRRILPLTIVRKFQALGREAEIKDENNNFFDTKELLGKVECLLNNKRIYKEISGYKLLIDSSQHSYSLNIDPLDVEGAAVKIRLLLDDLF